MTIVICPQESEETMPKIPRDLPAGTNGRCGDRHATVIDAHVGSRVRLRRTLLGLSQETLGRHLGLTFQQIQKYERGTNRIGASRLYHLSLILDVPVSFFFDNMPDAVPNPARGLGDDGIDITQRANLDLVRAFAAVRDPLVRQDIMRFIRSVADFHEMAPPPPRAAPVKRQTRGRRSTAA